ncbi:MAG: glycerophosphodiester phosphodiesterase [Alphaproteobacteria bacterium]
MISFPPFPRVIGHRGAAGHAPENTLAGFAKAAALGVRWVEFDVVLSADGVPVLFHDDTLDRTSDGSGPVGLYDFEHLRRLDAGAWFDPAFSGERIPTLDEAIAALAQLGLGANVEIKPSPGRESETGTAVAQRVARDWPAQLPPPILSSFAEASLAAAQDAAPDLPRALLVGALPEDWRARAERLGCGAIHGAQNRLSAADCAAVRAAGFRLLSYTVNDTDTARRLFAWGVEAVFSDVPDRIAPAVPGDT